MSPTVTPHLLPQRHLLAVAALALLAGAALWTGCVRAASAPPVLAPQGDDGSTDRLIVRYRSDGTRRPDMHVAVQPGAVAAQHLQAAGLQTVFAHRNGLGARVLRLNRPVPAVELDALARQIMADDPDVLYAEPDRRLFAQATPTDPLYGSQWHYHEAKGGLRLPAAWDMTDGSGVVVAVLDTGVRPHPDLAANLVSGYDFISSVSMANDGDARDANPMDPGDGCNNAHSSWHGTHVAGTIAAVSDNGEGGAGVAPGAKIMPVRVLGCGGGYFSDISDGILWASGRAVGSAAAPSQPARVLNLSLGGRGSCPITLQNAINTARAAGAVVVVAAGNSNQDASLHTPANCTGVITVGATGRGGARAYYSNYGAKVDVAAPGGDQSGGTANGVLSTLNAGYSTPGFDNYEYYQGTSMATPHVAGVAALMLSRRPELGPDDVEVLLKSTARALPVACSVGCGKGIVDAAAAVASVSLGTDSVTAVTDTEPNSTHAASQALTSLPASVHGTLATAADLDVFKVAVGARKSLKVRLIGNAESNYDLNVRNGAGKVLKSSTRAGGLTDSVIWTNPAASAATVYLHVKRTSGLAGATGTYTLDVWY